MAKAFPIYFQQAEYCAFYFEDTHLLLVRFERDGHRMWFVVDEIGDDLVTLGYPGDLYVEQLRDKVEDIFFVELTEAAGPPRKLALGAYFPVGDEWYGAYYDRGQEPRTLYFLRVVGDGPGASLEAVEQASEHGRVAEAFSKKYAGLFSINA